MFEEAGAELSAGPALLLVDDWAAMCGARGSWRATLSALDGVVASGRFRAVCVVALRETVPAPALAALHRVARCSARAIAPSADAGRVEERDAAAALAQTRDVTCGVYAVVSEAAVRPRRCSDNLPASSLHPCLAPYPDGAPREGGPAERWLCWRLAGRTLPAGCRGRPGSA